MAIICGNISSLMQKEEIKIDELGRWIVIPISNGVKNIIMIVIYRSQQSSNVGVYTLIAQYNQMNRKVQSSTHYRKEILKQIKRYLETIETDYQIVIGGD